MENFFDFSRLSLDDGNIRVKTESTVKNSEINSCIDSMPLAMAYVPMQRFRALYEPEAALGRGTIFAELDMPFTGCKKNWRAM